MKIRLLGTAAGGGFPQWNCACPNCDGIRRGTIRARPRREFCVAVTGNDRDWFLINAPPDVRAQLESFSALTPSEATRSTPIAGVLLTSADLDNVLGLMTLREGPALAIYATAGTRQALQLGFSLPPLLEKYAGARWHEPPPTRSPLCTRDGRPSGVECEAFLVDRHPPRYLGSRGAEAFGDRVGYVITDSITRARLVVLPGFSALDAALRDRIADCDLLLLDGSFWSEDELQRQATGARSAAAMGHLPVGGAGGSLNIIKTLKARRTIYVHVNNTNPMLNEESTEHAAVRAAGAEVGYDGLDILL
ncbi:MAG TPA: pyrroloquinoline quinone biosynthesis protein PqqB [Planctomycetaceae bacterium]|nr:pyrroloquinoline quinone biosynthesis protein PqqB [Planctomycetaceae bacterium]